MVSRRCLMTCRGRSLILCISPFSLEARIPNRLARTSRFFCGYPGLLLAVYSTWFQLIVESKWNRWNQFD